MPLRFCENQANYTAMNKLAVKGLKCFIRHFLRSITCIVERKHPACLKFITTKQFRKVYIFRSTVSCLKDKEQLRGQ